MEEDQKLDRRFRDLEWRLTMLELRLLINSKLDELEKRLRRLESRMNA